MRLVAAGALMAGAWSGLHDLAAGTGVLAVLEIGAAILLLAGLWTPIVGVAVAVLELGRAAAQPGDPWARILLSTLGAALALLGPGGWSIDARLFGWKRIDVRDRKDAGPPG